MEPNPTLTKQIHQEISSTWGVLGTEEFSKFLQEKSANKADPKILTEKDIYNTCFEIIETTSPEQFIKDLKIERVKSKVNQETYDFIVSSISNEFLISRESIISTCSKKIKLNQKYAKGVLMIILRDIYDLDHWEMCSMLSCHEITGYRYISTINRLGTKLEEERQVSEKLTNLKRTILNFKNTTHDRTITTC